MIPCISRGTLKLLTGTADERYANSREYFRATHYPQVMRRYYKSEVLEEVTQEEFLVELESAEDAGGNRLYFIYGSTGAGKSELLCWLRDEWLTRKIQRPVIRISRSELNPQVLIKKCYEILGMTDRVDIDESKWELLLTKPVTLVNQMVWSSLNEMFDNDDQIIPAALLITPIIEKNIVDFTNALRTARQLPELEILSLSQFDDLTQSTTLPLYIDYHQFRQSLTHKLDQFLFSGRSVAELFIDLSKQIRELEVRPLLLVDDLVQSVNIYASELLDHFLSLEEGTWDVVIGLTPGALNDTDRGKTLSQRIQNLDSIGDRVKKLWLSDESGRQFFNLRREDVVPYMSNYLVQLKSNEGYTCGQTCQHYRACCQLLPDTQDATLLPLNIHLVQRIYDGIPSGKGKLRYTIMNAKEVISALISGKGRRLLRTSPFVARDLYVEHDDPVIKTLAEWYVHPEANTFSLSLPLAKNFDYATAHELPVHKLAYTITQSVARETMSTQSEESWKDIRAWVEGTAINPQLLRVARQGVATIVHEALKGTMISRRFTSRNGSTLLRSVVTQGSKYPVILEGENVARSEGIFARKGLAVIKVGQFQDLKITQRPNAFNQLATEHELARWIYEAEEVTHAWRTSIENNFSMPLPKFAFLLKAWSERWITLQQFSFHTLSSPFSDSVQQLITMFFEDWFLLRDNIVDATMLGELEYEDDFEELFLSLKPAKFLDEYHFGPKDFGLFLMDLQRTFISYTENLKPLIEKELAKQRDMLQFITAEGYQSNQSDLFSVALLESHSSSNFSVDDIKQLGQNSVWLEEQHISEKYGEAQDLRDNYLSLAQQCRSLSTKIAETVYYITREVQPPVMTYLTSWNRQDLKLELAKLEKQLQILEETSQILHATPRHLVRRILESPVRDDVILKFRSAWNSMVELVCEVVAGQTKAGTDVVLQDWAKQNIHTLHRYVQQAELQHQQANLVCQLILEDLGCNTDDIDLDKTIVTIKQHDAISTSLKKKLVKFITSGEFVIPRYRWKNMLTELEQQFPSTRNQLDVHLRVTRHGKP